MATRLLRIAAAAALPVAMFHLLTEPASAACGAVSESATAGSVSSAAWKAKNKAKSKIVRSAGASALSRTSYSEPACYYLDDGSNRVRCTVTASFCTDPPLPGGGGNPTGGSTNTLEGQPTMPTMPTMPGGFNGCTTLRATATGNGVNQATKLVRNALSSSLKQQTGKSLSSHGVSASEPACYYLDNGTNQVRCQMTATACP